MKNITIENKSKWPDWFIEAAVLFAAKRGEITWGYRFTMYDRSVSYWSGRGGTKHGWARISRRRFSNKPWVEKDSRFGWSDKLPLTGRVQSCLFLIFHEMCHATRDNRARFARVDAAGRRNCDGGEFHANQWAHAAVQDFAREWPALVAGVRARHRRDRQRRQARAMTVARVEAVKNSPEWKVQECEARIAEWEAKARRCETFIRKYKRRLRALSAAQTRRMAASPKS